MTTLARKQPEYDSHKIYADYHQMFDNLHLFLLDTNVIVDEDEIGALDIDWNEHQRFLKVFINCANEDTLNISIPSEQFEDWVERGFKF